VVGDGCSDDSEQVVTAITDPRVRWINLPVNDGHQSEPNNQGLVQARGSIIAYLGHDDLWLPHHLEVMVAAIDAGADVAHSTVHMIGPEGNPATRREMQRFQPGQWMPPTGVAHRRIATEKVGRWGTTAIFRWLTAVKFPALYRKDIYKSDRATNSSSGPTASSRKRT